MPSTKCIDAKHMLVSCRATHRDFMSGRGISNCLRSAALCWLWGTPTKVSVSRNTFLPPRCGLTFTANWNMKCGKTKDQAGGTSFYLRRGGKATFQSGHGCIRFLETVKCDSGFFFFSVGRRKRCRSRGLVDFMNVDWVLLYICVCSEQKESRRLCLNAWKKKAVKINCTFTNAF